MITNKKASSLENPLMTLNFYFNPLVNGININSAIMPTSPITTPSTIFPNTMHKHIPIPNKSAPKIDKMIVPTVFPLKWIGSFPSILLHTINVIRRITSPITPAITPCRNIPHSSISAMHIPSAKNTIPIVPSINAAKLLFFMFVFLHYFLSYFSCF